MTYAIYLFILLLNFIYPNDIKPGMFSITRIHYGGGGDWYSDPSSIPNLLKFVNNNTNISVDLFEKRAKIIEDNFSNGSYLYLTGHGNINFNEEEAQILREHLLAGAFLHADDNYGMDKSFRREIKKVFPDKDLVELPNDHPIFNIFYQFPNGLPKIHEHDKNRPQALGIFADNKLIVLYTFESDLGDGWEDGKVHNDSEELRKSALEMGTNIILYALAR